MSDEERREAGVIKGIRKYMFCALAEREGCWSVLVVRVQSKLYRSERASWLWNAEHTSRLDPAEPGIAPGDDHAWSQEPHPPARQCRRRRYTF